MPQQGRDFYVRPHRAGSQRSTRDLAFDRLATTS